MSTERQPVPEGARATAPLRVLIVEDLPRVQAALRELIHDPGRLEVAAIADSEHEAIAAYRALTPDALVIDLSLREGNGLGVLAAVRSHAAARRPLLIVLTNRAFPVLEAACRRAGADHFLDKSRDFPRVRGLLEAALPATG